MSAPSIPPGGASRADARRNRARVLAAAQRAFAEGGLGVSLAEIARRAGVGAGTVYRHFPTKTDLLEAVLQQRVDGLARMATARLRDPDPGAAFFAVCAEVVASSPGNQALCDLVQSDDGWPKALLRGAGERFQRALAELLRAAQRQGSVRADITVTEVQQIFAGCVAIQRFQRPDGQLVRAAVLVLDALRTNPAVTSVTKVEPERSRRNETVARDESGAVSHCPICRAPLRRTGMGRPARYCSPACRQKAHRRRHAGRLTS
ncbi:helix-turn-helix domain-containing protein [Nocardia sp. NPDC005366]|uniref:TetR/AcrR family transcriptional regulator n=1 Tax=Nocardia sp. NPDC005366 TaxID=3156878 RepID=UPI0033B76688